MPDAPRVIGGKYELVRLLGRGSMGEVWVAEHRTLREEVALKLLQRPPWIESFEDASTSAARFRFEAQVAARLSRKTRHIVRVTDHGEEQGMAYLVMELLEGVTLETRFMRYGCMSPSEVSNIVVQLSRALEHAHAEGVLHRDLKPSNVFLTVDEDGAPLVKAFDFGIACLTRPHRLMPVRLTAQGMLFGTPGYMSPEQARGRIHLDFQCDLWALATIAYEALTGELPLDGADSDELLRNLGAGRLVPLRQRCPELPEALDAFFRRAFADDVADRFRSAADMAQGFGIAAGGAAARWALDSVRAGCEEASPEKTSASRPRVRAPARRRDTLLAAASLFFGSVVACGGALMGQDSAAGSLTSAAATASALTVAADEHDEPGNGPQGEDPPSPWAESANAARVVPVNTEDVPRVEERASAETPPRPVAIAPTPPPPVNPAERPSPRPAPPPTMAVRREIDKSAIL